MKKRWIRRLLVLAVLVGAVSAFVWGCADSKSTGGSGSGAQSTGAVADTSTADSADARESTLADGTYSLAVTLEGGSGRASIQSPTEVVVKDGRITAQIVWSSPFYDYMLLDQKKVLPDDYSDADEHSRFTIPIAALDEPISVIADTTAMSQPHEIEYTITVHSSETGSTASAAISSAAPTSSDAAAGTADGKQAQSGRSAWRNFVPEGYTVQKTQNNDYAQHFQIQELSDAEGKEGYRLLSLSDDSQFLVLPEGMKKSQAKERGKTEDCTVLTCPLKNGYLAATAAMAHFVRLDALDTLSYVGTKKSGWTIPEAQEAMESGALRYAGKYSAPEYERLLAGKTQLAIESTMILHTPQVGEKLQELGIPVLMDLSSYEDHPLGRAEWVRAYGVLAGKEQEADQVFARQKSGVEQVQEKIPQSGEKKTVAFFAIDSQGRAVVRRSEDYIPAMIAMAGGEYIFDDLKSRNPDSHSGSVTLTLEEFYARAKDADVLIYNAAIEDPVRTIAELTKKSPTLADFAAVKSGEVWVANSSMYQATDSVAEIVTALQEILANGETDSAFFTRVRGD